MPPLRFRYQTIEFRGLDLHVRTLRDRQQFFDVEGEAEALGISSANWPMFGVIWESARTLAGLMVDYPTAELRILEVGCGIALPSLVLRQREADITATDYNPAAGTFLAVSSSLNDGGDVPFVLSSWTAPAAGLGLFDLIIGSDLLYERGHPAELAGFIDGLAHAHSKMILVDPGRGMATKFIKHMAEYSFDHESEPSADPADGVTVHSFTR